VDDRIGRGSPGRLTATIAIPPLPPDSGRPLWSVMIPTHGSGSYLRDALLSVLAQDPGAGTMQIAVIDDASTPADALELVEEVGGGRVEYFRQSVNVGHVRNFDTCVLRARGHLVHLLHGDDRVKPGFYQTLEMAFRRHPEIGAAFCRNDFIDERGAPFAASPLVREIAEVVPDWLETIATWQRVQAPAIAVRRAVYEALGGFDRRIVSVGEDWEMWVRVASRYPVWYTPEVLAEYRVHRVSLTAVSLRTGQNFRDLRRVIAINRERLPTASESRVTRAARQACALWGLVLAGRLISSREWSAACRQMVEAIRCDRSPRVILRAVRLMLRAGRVALFGTGSAAAASAAQAGDAAPP
jgi:GT2 family glycosyltransferase